MNAGEYELARELKEKIAARLRSEPVASGVVGNNNLWELARDIAELQVKVQRLLPTLPPRAKDPPPF